MAAVLDSWRLSRHLLRFAAFIQNFPDRFSCLRLIADKFDRMKSILKSEYLL